MSKILETYQCTRCSKEFTVLFHYDRDMSLCPSCEMESITNMIEGMVNDNNKLCLLVNKVFDMLSDIEWATDELNKYDIMNEIGKIKTIIYTESK